MTAGRRMEPDDLRSFALSLPAVEERETWDHPTFRVRNKMFLTLAGDGSTATLKATPADQTPVGGHAHPSLGHLRATSTARSLNERAAAER